jgi:hypothetical protein
LALALGISAFAFATFLAMLGSDPGAWQARGVMASRITHFIDLGNILAGARCASHGMDVLLANPCDPFGRPMNYPRIWLWIANHLGLTFGSPLWPGIILAGLFFIAAAFLPRIRTLPHALVWLMALLSPAVTLAVERGNNDLVVFLLAVPGLALAKGGTRARHASAIAFLLAAVLKLFPAIGLLLLPSRRILGRVGWIYPALFAAYLVATFRDVMTIATVVPRDLIVSFGGENTIRMFAHLVLRTTVSNALALPMGYGLAVVLVGVGLYLGRRTPTVESAPGRTFPELLYATLIFLGSFTLGTSYDYRLVFLLLALPTSLDAGQGSLGEEVRPLGRWCTGLILVSLWAGSLFPQTSPLLTWPLLSLDLLATPLLVSALVAFAVRLHRSPSHAPRRALIAQTPHP